MAESRNDQSLYCITEVRRHDHDRYLTTLLAPEDRQSALFALLTFNLEVAKTAEVVSEPMLGQIRLQWWREAIEESFAGKTRRHAVLDVLSPAIFTYALTQSHFQTLIDAREEDLLEYPPKTLEDLESYAERSTATLVWLSLQVLGIDEGPAFEAGRHLGIAWSLIGLMRALPFHLGERRPCLPQDVMDLSGLSHTDLRDRRRLENLPEAVRVICEKAGAHLLEARQRRQDVPRTALPGLMIGPLASGYLKALAAARYDPAHPRVQAANRLNAWRLAVARLRQRY